jgi:hypothetical protein
LVGSGIEFQVSAVSLSSDGASPVRHPVVYSGAGEACR